MEYSYGTNMGVWEKKFGGGLVSLFGMPFLLVGLGILFFVVPKAPEAQIFLVIFGSIFALVGSLIVFGRKVIKIDKTRNLVTTWVGLLVPFKTTTYRLSNTGKVTISKEERSSKNSNYIVYPVRLITDSDKIEIFEPRTYEEAHTEAEAIAKTCHYDIEETISGKHSTVEFNKLDESFTDRLKRTGESLKQVDAPEKMKLLILNQSSPLKIVIPGSSMFPIFFKSLIPMAFIGYFYYSVSNTGNGDTFSENSGAKPFIIFLGFFLIVTVIIPLFFSLKKHHTAIMVEVNNALITLHYKTLFKVEVIEIPTTTIEEISIAEVYGTNSRRGSQGVQIRSDHHIANLGGNLSYGEQKYLTYLIQNEVTDNF